MHSLQHYNIENQNDQLKRDNETLKNERNEAIDAINTLHNQQCELFQNFKLLRSKYDDLKNEIQHILWEFIPCQSHEQAINGFSDLGIANLSSFESPNRICNYMIGQLLGEGQFANVHLCIDTITQKEYAVKIINKKKVTTLSGLKRINNEVRVLKKLDHPNIVTFVDFIHSTKNLYIITEVGGKDLFEFFEANRQGVTDETARQIILGIVKPLLYLHQSGICHLDLKPENILLSDKKEGFELHQSIQICDFGQSMITSSKYSPRVSGLCGSPGFFAPEMILRGGEKYDGFAADVWSVGCVMLELTRGHDQFCKIWMTTYDYEILQDEYHFEQSLNKAVDVVGRCEQNIDLDDMGRKLCNFLRKLLVLDPTCRLKASEMLEHPWLSDERDPTSLSTPQIPAPNQENDSFELSSEESSDETSKSRAKKRNMFRDSFSSRARKHFAGSIKVDSDKDDFKFVNKDYERIEIRLPPVEPETPSFKAAKRTILEGRKIKSKHIR